MQIIKNNKWFKNYIKEKEKGELVFNSFYDLHLVTVLFMFLGVVALGLLWALFEGVHIVPICILFLIVWWAALYKFSFVLAGWEWFVNNKSGNTLREIVPSERQLNVEALLRRAEGAINSSKHFDNLEKSEALDGLKTLKELWHPSLSKGKEKL